MRAYLKAACLIAGLATLSASGVAAQSLRYNSFMPPKSITALGAEKFFDDLKTATNGKLRARVFSGGQLLGGQATLAGIRDGVVDAGLIIPTLNSSDIPTVAMMGEMLPFAEDAWVSTGATNETALLDCQECKDELAKHNAVWVGGYGSPPWYLMCRDPIKDFSSLRGRKVRVTGGFATRMIDALGGVAVNMTPGEIGPALQQGQIDCAVGNLAWLTTLSFLDSVKAIVDMPLGSYHGVGLLVFNKASLAKLNEAEKKEMVKLIPKHLASIVQAYQNEEADAKAAAEKKKVQFWTPSPEFKAALEKFKEGEEKALVSDMTRLGAKNAQASVKSHLENLKSWSEIVKKSGTTPDAFAEALRKNVFDKATF